MSFFSSMLGNSGVVDPQKLHADYGRLLAHGEVIEVGFAVFRDTFVLTTKRLILVDVQGLTGKRSNISLFHIKISPSLILKPQGTLTSTQN